MQYSLSYKINKYRIRSKNADSEYRKDVYDKKIQYYNKKLQSMIGGGIIAVDKSFNNKNIDGTNVKNTIDNISKTIEAMNKFLISGGTEMGSIKSFYDVIINSVNKIKNPVVVPPNPVVVQAQEGKGSPAVKIFRDLFPKQNNKKLISGDYKLELNLKFLTDFTIKNIVQIQENAMKDGKKIELLTKNKNLPVKQGTIIIQSLKAVITHLLLNLKFFPAEAFYQKMCTAILSSMSKNKPFDIGKDAETKNPSINVTI